MADLSKLRKKIKPVVVAVGGSIALVTGLGVVSTTVSCGNLMPPDFFDEMTLPEPDLIPTTDNKQVLTDALKDMPAPEVTPEDPGFIDEHMGSLPDEGLLASFGKPCVDNEDCNNSKGVCVSTAEGKKCTWYCVDTCPEGYSCEEYPEPESETPSYFVCLEEDKEPTPKDVGSVVDPGKASVDEGGVTDKGLSPPDVQELPSKDVDDSKGDADEVPAVPVPGDDE